MAKMTKAYMRAWRKNHPEKGKDYWYRYQFGVSYAEFLVLAQNGCELCGEMRLGRGGLGIDHNHETGKIRGILCQRCNVGLSFLDDVVWLKKARNYWAKGNK